MGTITFSAKRSNPCSGVRSRYAVCSRYAVRSRCWCKKVNSHSGLSKYGWWGPLPLVQKGQAHRVGICSTYAVHSRYAVRSRTWCNKVNSHSGLSKYGWWGPLPLVQKGQTPCNEDAVCSRCCCKKVNSDSVLFAPTPAYCIPHCVGFDLFALKVMVPTTHIW